MAFLAQQMAYLVLAFFLKICKDNFKNYNRLHKKAGYLDEPGTI